MNNLDDMIDVALDAEERELLRAIGEEPGFVERAMGLFGAGGVVHRRRLGGVALL